MDLFLLPRKILIFYELGNELPGKIHSIGHYFLFDWILFWEYLVLFLKPQKRVEFIKSFPILLSWKLKFDLKFNFPNL